VLRHSPVLLFRQLLETSRRTKRTAHGLAVSAGCSSCRRLQLVQLEGMLSRTSLGYSQGKNFNRVNKLGMSHNP
jgi:hypothetical protein